MTAATTIEDVNSELTLRLRQAELATGFANFGLRSRDLQTILDEACRVAAKGMGCALAKVLRHLRDEDRFVMVAGTGWRPGLVGRATIGADLESPAGYAFRTGEPVLSNHLAAETRFRTPILLVEHDVHRAFNVLVPVEGGRFGVLEVDSPDEGDFSVSDTAFLQNLAATLGHAIDRHAQVEELEAGRSRLRAANRMLEGDVLRRTHERDHLWETGQDLLVVGDREARLLNANPFWTTLLGWERHEVVGGPLAAKVHPECLQTVLDAIERMLVTGAPVRFENRMACRDGSWRWVSWNASAAGDSGLFTAVGRDVTDLRDQQRQLALAQESLRQSQKMEAVGQLTGGLAHDFNNMLTGVTGGLELIERRVSQGRHDEVTRYVGVARDAAARAAALTHRLLAFSRRQTLAPAVTDVDALVAGMADLVRRTAGPSIEVRFVSGRVPRTALVDPNQLENALLNLCINARDAMPDGGRLLVERAQVHLDGTDPDTAELPRGDYLTLSVTDTGGGMPPEVVSRAFDPFFTTKPMGMGTGLGLSMIDGFVRQSGGMARIHSQPGLGTTVILFLPVHDAEARSAASAAPVPQVRARSGESVLVVDDEASVRTLLADVLGERGYAVLVAPDGRSGLEVVRSPARIDLLVTDVGLPGGMDGRQVARAARVSRPGLKVLFVTGYAEGAVLPDGAHDPATQVMTKPFAMDELAARVAAMLSG